MKNDLQYKAIPDLENKIGTNLGRRCKFDVLGDIFNNQVILDLSRDTLDKVTVLGVAYSVMRLKELKLLRIR